MLDPWILLILMLNMFLASSHGTHIITIFFYSNNMITCLDYGLYQSRTTIMFLTPNPNDVIIR